MITREQLVEFDTRIHRQLYRQNRNGIHVWCAYLRARRLRVLPPDWVFTYFDDVAKRLIAPAGTTTPTAIAAALRLRTRRGGPSARTRALKATERAGLREKVCAMNAAEPERR